ncbi:hypothetical protein B0H17DRAFT_1151279 [Mycena rosella]|uniref:Uncharacterized protein n=1 Tax=Mycena rosella TaxID=1033263 RepID=A0AAD7FI19_MYCRO|nr:hypothetical protein B0H17DRAFT_1151279 [Mycena rosella]
MAGRRLQNELAPGAVRPPAVQYYCYPRTKRTPIPPSGFFSTQGGSGYPPSVGYRDIPSILKRGQRRRRPHPRAPKIHGDRRVRTDGFFASIDVGRCGYGRAASLLASRMLHGRDRVRRQLQAIVSSVEDNSVYHRRALRARRGKEKRRDATSSAAGSSREGEEAGRNARGTEEALRDARTAATLRACGAPACAFTPAPSDAARLAGHPRLIRTRLAPLLPYVAFERKKRERERETHPLPSTMAMVFSALDDRVANAGTWKEWVSGCVGRRMKEARRKHRREWEEAGDRGERVGYAEESPGNGWAPVHSVMPVWGEKGCKVPKSGQEKARHAPAPSEFQGQAHPSERDIRRRPAGRNESGREAVEGRTERIGIALEEQGSGGTASRRPQYRVSHWCGAEEGLHHQIRKNQVLPRSSDEHIMRLTDYTVREPQSSESMVAVRFFHIRVGGGVAQWAAD